MKKTPCIVFLASILAVYLAMACCFLIDWEAVALPEAVDQQTVTVEKGELICGGQRTELALPDYFDVIGETRLQFTLEYAFSGRTVPSLILQANHTFMTILLDGEELYRVEPRPYSLGNYFTRIPLPQEAHGALLEIRVTVPESGLTRVSMHALVIANEAAFLTQQILRDVPALILNTLIFLSGLLLMALAVMGRKSIDPYRMLLRGAFALNCALYFACETYSVVFLVSGSRIVYIADMLSFALLGPMLLVLLGWELEDWRGRWLHTIAWIGLAMAVTQIALSQLLGVELRRLLPMTHAVQIVGILAMLVCIAYGLLYKKSNRGLYLGGLIALGGAVDMVLFLCEVGENDVFFLKIGLLAYLLYQMDQFVRLLMKRSAEEARESYYKTLAMQDPLSHCYSRAAFELDRDAWRGEPVRTVFFLDLNNLKSTNDLYGHSAGDQLIHAFGSVLNQVFCSVGKCYRVGGDEFWAVCDGLPPGQSADMMQAAQRAIDGYNRFSTLPSPLSYAIGACDTAETQGDLSRAIELADARMYENKRAVKKGLHC
ncbi:MAG: GGDEF domain-containing protein [Oscillibacter sp.]